LWVSLVATVRDQFYPTGYPGFSLLKMTKLCTPVNQGGEDPTAPAHVGHLSCYLAKLPQGIKFAPRIVSTNNTNFGAQVLKVNNTAELYVPAERNP
jgi:hypothetical protein